MVLLDAVYVGPKEQDDVIRALYDELKDSGEIELLPYDTRVSWTVPQTLFNDAMGPAHWYMSQTYFPDDKLIPAESLPRQHWTRIPSFPLTR
jgi:hypothetical protein